MSNLGKHWKIKDTSKMKGRHPAHEFKKGITPWNKGTKGKMPPRSQAWKDAMSKMKGRKITWGNKISKSLTGKIIPLTARNNMSKAREGKYAGKNHPNWKGGITSKEVRAGRPRPKYCEICGRAGRICFDHDHETGKFRGWLCHKCNVTLGLVDDNVDILLKLIKYLTPQ